MCLLKYLFLLLNLIVLCNCFFFPDKYDEIRDNGFKDNSRCKMICYNDDEADDIQSVMQQHRPIMNIRDASNRRKRHTMQAYYARNPSRLADLPYPINRNI